MTVHRLGRIDDDHDDGVDKMPGSVRIKSIHATGTARVDFHQASVAYEHISSVAAAETVRKGRLLTDTLIQTHRVSDEEKEWHL